MEPKNSIREQLARYINMNNITLSRFSEVSGINTGTISRILHGNRPISFSQLIAISAGMGVAEDHFFDDYVEECFAFSVSIRRIKPFIIQSAKLGRLDCIERVLHQLLDDVAYTTELFEIAEQLFENNLGTAAAFLYRGVSEVEKYQHSERLATCHYRLFLIELGKNLGDNARIATQFEPYVNRLNEADQLDALKHMIHVFVTLHDWKKVDKLAKEMVSLAKVQYNLQQQFKGKWDREKQSERPVYFYVLYGWLVRSSVFEQYGDYAKALDFVSLYEDGQSWVLENDEESKRILKQFGEWATANTYLYRLLAGELEILPDYVEYISEHEDEIFIALRYIVKSANRFNINIDHILERFKEYIPLRNYKTEFGEYDPAIVDEGYSQFLSDLAIYYLNKNQPDAILLVLKGLYFSLKINSDRNIITCMTLFEQYRDRADSVAKQKFKYLTSEVQRLNAEKSTFIFDSV